MDEAFDRLTEVQKYSVNKVAFAVAYTIVAKHGDQNTDLRSAVLQETSSCPHLTQDLFRYCRLARSVM